MDVIDREENNTGLGCDDDPHCPGVPERLSSIAQQLRASDILPADDEEPPFNVVFCFYLGMALLILYGVYLYAAKHYAGYKRRQDILYVLRLCLVSRTLV